MLRLIKPIIRYPKELVRPPVKVVAANCLWKAPRPLGLGLGQILENWGRGLDKQAC